MLLGYRGAAAQLIARPLACTRGTHWASAFTGDERENIIASAMKKRGLSRSAVEQLLDSITNRRAKRNPLLEQQWVRTLVAACEDLKTARARPNGLLVTTFWIRLYGAMTDLRARYETSAEFHRDLVADGLTQRYFAACAGVFESCCALREALSDDQLVYAAFARHVQTHVYQDGFEYGIERGNPARNQPAKLRTKQMVGTIGRHIDIDEVHEIVDRASAVHGHDDARIAASFARLVSPHVERLASAMEALGAERENDRLETARRRR